MDSVVENAGPPPRHDPGLLPRTRHPGKRVLRRRGGKVSARSWQKMHGAMREVGGATFSIRSGPHFVDWNQGHLECVMGRESSFCLVPMTNERHWSWRGRAAVMVGGGSSSDTYRLPSCDMTGRTAKRRGNRATWDKYFRQGTKRERSSGDEVIDRRYL